MPIYYGRFRYVDSLDNNSKNVKEDLMSFFDIDSSKEYIKKQITEQFEEVFRGNYGKYGQKYVLLEFGKVIKGSGFVVKENLEKISKQEIK